MNTKINNSNNNIKAGTIDNPDPITNLKSLLKPNPTSSSSYPNFYTVFSPKTTAPSLSEKNDSTKNDKNVKSEICTNIDVNPCIKSIVNKKYNDDNYCEKKEVEVGVKCVSEVNLRSRTEQNSDPRYLARTQLRDNVGVNVPNTISTSTSLSSPFKNQRISPIILDNTSLMNILTERSLPKTNIKSDVSAYVKFCGNIYDSDTDDEGRYRTKDDKNSNFGHQNSTNVCESPTSNMENFVFSQNECEIHEHNKYNNNNNSNENSDDVKMKINECVDSVRIYDNDNNKNDNNDNEDNNNVSTRRREFKCDGDVVSVQNNTHEKVSRGVEGGGSEVEEGELRRIEGVNMNELKIFENIKSVMQCDQKQSEDLLLFSASNSITLPYSTQYDNNESNNEILGNNMFLSSILDINPSKEKERERDFMNDSNRQLSPSLLPIITNKEDINEKIQTLRDEIDFNNLLNARSMRFLDAKSENNKDKINSNNLNDELLYATVTDLIEYNTDNDCFPCETLSEESSQLFTFPTIQNSNTFDNTSDSDCNQVPLSLPLSLHHSQPSMTLFNRDNDGNNNKINEKQKFQLFTPDNKFDEKNYLDKNESKIFDTDNDNDNDDNDDDDENDNICDNNVERDSGICPFAISLNEQNFPFVDIALSTYNVFDARTNSTSNINLSENNDKDSSDNLQKMKVTGKNEYNDNIILKVNAQQHVQTVNNNNNNNNNDNNNENNSNNNKSKKDRVSEKEKETNSIQIDYKNFYKNENETLKNFCSQNIPQNFLRNKDEDVLEESSGKDVEDMMRLTSILTAFKTALKLKNVLFSLLLDKEESQNSLNISGNTKSIKPNSIKLDSRTSTALTNLSTYDSNSEIIDEKMVSYKKENENENEKNDVKNQILEDNILSDANTKKIVKELIQFLSSKHIGSNLKFGDAQLTASSLSSFDFVEFFLFFLDIQVLIHLFLRSFSFFLIFLEIFFFAFILHLPLFSHVFLLFLLIFIFIHYYLFVTGWETMETCS